MVDGRQISRQVYKTPTKVEPKVYNEGRLRELWL